MPNKILYASDLHGNKDFYNKLIKKARDVLKLSKQLIYSVHRKNLEEADELVKNVKKEKGELDKIASSDKKLIYEGSYSEACQEYVEAMAYYGFIKDKKIPAVSSLNVDEEDYLMGICDLTGELTRKAVTIAHKDEKEVEKIKNLVEDIFFLMTICQLREMSCLDYAKKFSLRV